MNGPKRMEGIERGEEVHEINQQKPWYRRIGVEPTMFLYMMAFMLTSVIEEAFFVYKACRVNAGLPEDVCQNISHHQEQKRVQVIVANFNMWENLASQGVPVILAFYVGSWSDKVGRKLPLLIGLAGNLFYSVMIVVNAVQDTWPVQWVLLTASLPCSLTGSNLTVFMASFSYLADTTSQRERTIRVTLLEVAYLLPMPIGIFVGSYLYNHVVNRSFAAMFAINSFFLLAAILYTLIALEWKTAPSPVSTIVSGRRSCIRSMFRPIYETLKALLKPRDEHRRLFLLLVIFSMALYTFQRDEKRVMYLYSQVKFHWSVADISNFRTFQSLLFVFGLLIGVPLMTKWLALKDMMVILVGAVSHSAARIVFTSANQASLLYVGTVLGLLGPTVAPVLRSVVSKLVPASERGKIYAMFSVSDNAVPVISGVVYNGIYKATLNSFPQSIFIVTIASQMVVFAIALYMLLKLKGRAIMQAEDAVPVVT